MLRIAKGLDLPNDLITQAIAILARRGAGKTYTASVIVEEVIGAGLPVCVIDPTGAWWGLRSSADGRRAGLSVIILGGSHGDVPLEPTAGRVIADLVVDHPGAYVLDLSSFESNAAQDRFVTDFMERLYRAKAERRDALLLVVDEADSFAPQRPQANQLRMLGALEAIVRRGRIRGLGCLLITQRAAVLNKNVLTQIEMLIAMQTTSPQDRAAIDAWIEATGSKDERAEVMGSLAQLSQGEAWVWSPSWQRILVRVTVRKRRTFDSSKTPEAGTLAIVPKARAMVDLEALGARIAATVEQVKANDPAILRAKIADLERQLSMRPTEKTVERVEVPVEVPVFTPESIDVMVGVRDAANRLTELLSSSVAVALAQRPEPPPAFRVQVASPKAEVIGRERWPAKPVTPPVVNKPEYVAATSGSFGKAGNAILAALASYPIPLTREQLAFLAGYHPRTPGFSNALGTLRSAGLVSLSFPAELTDVGRAAAPPGRRLAPDELTAEWLGRFGKAERAILTIVMREYPQPVERQALADEAGYHPRTPGFSNALGKLRGLGIVDGFALSGEFAQLIGR